MTNLPAGYTWDASTLGSDGKFKVLAVTPTVPTTPTNLTFVATSTNVSLSWPGNYLGWSLQVQTNALTVGLQTPPGAWFTIPGTDLGHLDQLSDQQGRSDGVLSDDLHQRAVAVRPGGPAPSQ